MKPKTIVLLVLVILAVVIIIQNSMTIPFRLLFWSATGPLIFLVMGVFVVGVVVGYLAAKKDRGKEPKPPIEPGRSA